MTKKPYFQHFLQYGNLKEIIEEICGESIKELASTDEEFINLLDLVSRKSSDDRMKLLLQLFYQFISIVCELEKIKK